MDENKFNRRPQDMGFPTREAGTDDSSKQLADDRLDRYAEVVPDQTYAEAYVPTTYSNPPHDPYKYAYAPPTAATPLTGTAGHSPDPTSAKVADGKNGQRSRLILAVVAVAVAIVAGVLGGVVGWKVTESKAAACSAGSDGTGGSDSGLPVTCPAISGTTVGGAEKAIMKNSGLAAIGRRVDSNNIAIQLFYQGPDDALRISEFNSMFTNWTTPRLVDMTSSADKAASGTQLSISGIWTYVYSNIEVYDLQAQLSYKSPTGKLMGYNFRSAAWPNGLADSILQQNYSTSQNSGLSSLWPVQHYQDDTNTIYEVTSISTRAKLTGVTNAAGGTPLLALPLTSTHFKSELRLLYRDTSGNLSLFERESTGKTSNGTGSLGVDLPESATLAGFAYARDATNPSINSFVLWQDESKSSDNGGIRIMSQTDGTSAWKGPTSDPVFAKADVPTRIACALPAMGGTDMSGQVAVALSNKKDLNRCFFQSDGGKLRQVWYDGTQWIDLGYVLMP